MWSLLYQVFASQHLEKRGTYFRLTGERFYSVVTLPCTERTFRLAGGTTISLGSDPLSPLHQRPALRGLLSVRPEAHGSCRDENSRVDQAGGRAAAGAQGQRQACYLKQREPGLPPIMLLTQTSAEARRGAGAVLLPYCFVRNHRGSDGEHEKKRRGRKGQTVSKVRFC